MKYLIKRFKSISQSLIGINNYLYITSILKYYILNFRKSEEGIFKLIELIPENTIVLDVGSNVGVLTCTLAKRKKNVSIVSFEPIPLNATNIKKLIKIFGIRNVTLHQVALGNQEGTVEMIMPKFDNVLYEGYSHITKDNEVQSKGLRFSVVLKKLDNIFESHTYKKISAIKMDVENYEFEVLKGASAILKVAHPIIYCELWNNEIRYEVINYLFGFGYKCYVLKNKKLEETDGTGTNDLNFFFI